jgi:hypothetical protein
VTLRAAEGYIREPTLCPDPACPVGGPAGKPSKRHCRLNVARVDADNVSPADGLLRQFKPSIRFSFLGRMNGNENAWFNPYTAA